MVCEDSQTIKEAKAGKESAFAQLIEKYMKKTYSMAYALTGNSEDAKDISQETFLRVFRSLGTFNEKSSFKTWLYRIVINLCNDYYRQKLRFKFIFWDKDNEDAPNRNIETVLMPKSMDNNPRDKAVESELNERLNNAISKLSLKQKAVFVLKNFDGLLIKDIAKTLGCSEGTVKSHLHRACRKIQKKLRLFL
ncbi:MAG: RNA polymerase sigma factor [bacterium]|nr:RNA polymerase sigma factor [bacterium]